MGHEVYPASLTPQVLVIAAPNDPDALRLSNELSSLGLHVAIADTIEQAARADQAAACILLLHAGTWRTTPAIRTAMRCNPRYMLAVLCEPMALPGATWATQPISLNASPLVTAQELAGLITFYLRETPRPASVPKEPRLTAGSSAPSRQSSIFKRIRSRKHNWYNYLLLALIALLGAGLLVYLPSHFAHVDATTSVAQSVGPTVRHTLLDSPYTAAVPGLGCDMGGADWSVGGHFKTPGTPTVGTVITPTPPKGTPTLHIVSDTSVVDTCQPDGLLVKHNNYFNVFATTFFTSQSQTLPDHFRIQITVAAVNASDEAIFNLSVHNQYNYSTSGDDSGYGDDAIQVGVDGSWQTQRYNDRDGYPDVRFTKGFVKPARTFILAAEVDGSSMTFFINGQKVTTIVDATYPVGYGITFGMADSGIKNPPSALFSHFVYTPLSDTQQIPQSVVATATALAVQNRREPYSAAVPGFGCDKGTGQWQPVMAADKYVTTRCMSGGLVIAPVSSQYDGTVPFYWLDGNFPLNYKVKALIDVSGLNDGCAGFMTHSNEKRGGYSLFICSDGSWQIIRYDGNGKDLSQLATGQVAQRSSYVVEALSIGSAQSLVLDGVQVASVKDKMFTATDHIELFVGSRLTPTGEAVFSNFVFTPLV